MLEKQPKSLVWKYVLCTVLGFVLGAGIGITATRPTRSQTISTDIQDKQSNNPSSAENTDSPSKTKNGWVLENEKWYCYEDGTVQKNQWFYVGADGAMFADTWQKIDGQDYFFTPGGAMQTSEEIAAENASTKGKNTDTYKTENSSNSAGSKKGAADVSPSITNLEDYIGYFENDGFNQHPGTSGYVNIREIRDGRIYGEYYFTYAYLTEIGSFYEQGIPMDSDTFTIQEFRLYDDLDTVAAPHTVTLRAAQVNGTPALEFIRYDGEEIDSSYFIYKGKTKDASGWNEDPIGRYDFSNGYYVSDRGEQVYGLEGTVTMEITNVENNRVYGIFDFMASDDRIYEDFRESGILVNEGTFYVGGFKFQFVHDFDRSSDILLGLDTGLKWKIPKSSEFTSKEYTWMKMSPSEIEEEVSRIRKVWQTDREAVTNGTFERRQWKDNIFAYFQNGELKMVEVSRNNRNPYTKIFQIENGELTFAYYESSEMQMRLYYKNKGMFRWIQTDTGHGAVIHDQEDSRMFFQNAQWAAEDIGNILRNQGITP